MANKETIDKINSMEKAYTLFCAFTRLPFVECEQVDFFDRVLIYETKEDAEAAMQEYAKEKMKVSVNELGMKEMFVPNKDNEMMRVEISQVKQFMSMVRQLGVNAVGFQGAGAQMETIELKEILPKDFTDAITEEVMPMIKLQLNGIYFAQELRRDPENPNYEKLAELKDEYYASLVNATLLLPVIPPEGTKKDEDFSLRQSQMPYSKNGDKTYMSFFSDPGAVNAFSRGKEPRVLFIPFKEVLKFCPEECAGIVVNPTGFSLPVMRDEIPQMIAKYLKK